MYDSRAPGADSRADGPVVQRERRGRFSAWRKTFAGELIEVAIIALVLFLVARIAVQNFKVNGHSMFPTLHNNELLLVDKISYDFTSPHRGDIIVFKYPLDTSRDFIKRVIAVPGDRVTINNGRVFVNGAPLHETYIAHKPSYTMPFIPSNNNSPVVPKNDYFVLGDNRNKSDDSHLWGLVPRSDIIGRALITYWPPQDFGILTDPSTGGGH